MNYKKIVKNRSIRLSILRLLSFVPDKEMIKLQYRLKTGRALNLNNPRRFTEKIQWYKLYYKNPTMIKCVDKYKVREYVKSKGLESILIPEYGVFRSFREIDIDSLPDSFVIKNTLTGGGIGVIPINNKKNADWKTIRNISKKWRLGKKPIRDGGREWPYYNGDSPRILIEELLIDPEHPAEGINDYKFYCFNGVPKLVNVDIARFTNHRRNYYDMEWNILEIESNYPKYEKSFQKPESFEEMKMIASILSSDFPFARIDLYYNNKKIYFGEITFYPASGYMWYKPDTYDEKLGSYFLLENYTRL